MSTSVTTTILGAAAIVTAITVICAAVVKIVGWYLKQKRQDTEIAHIKSEMTVICFGVRACLDGLKQMGCNGNVSKAKEELDKHLNQAAHE